MGIRAKDTAAFWKLRAIAAAGMVGTAGSAILGTYLLTKGKHAIPRPGVPPGAIDTYENDEKGNPIYLASVLDEYGDAASRSGVADIAKALRQGKDPGEVFDAGASKIAQELFGIFRGPGTETAFEAATGHKGMLSLPPVEGSTPAQGSGLIQQTVAAWKNVNPFLNLATGGDVPPGDILESQLRAFMPGKGTPTSKMEGAAEAELWGRVASREDEIKLGANRQPLDERRAWIIDQINTWAQGVPEESRGAVIKRMKAKLLYGNTKNVRRIKRGIANEEDD